MWNVGFWRDTAERAVKTFAQAGAACLTVGMPIFEQDWTQAVGLAATAGVLSVLTSIASSGVGDSDTASVLTNHHVNY